MSCDAYPYDGLCNAKVTRVSWSLLESILDLTCYFILLAAVTTRKPATQ